MYRKGKWIIENRIDTSDSRVTLSHFEESIVCDENKMMNFNFSPLFRSIFLFLLLLLSFPTLSKSLASFYENDYESEDSKEILLNQCKFHKYSSGPHEFDGRNQAIEVTLSILRLVDVVDDGNFKLLSFHGGFYFNFYSDCLLKAAIDLNTTRRIDSYWLISNTDDFWRPALYHANSHSDFKMEKDSYWLIVAYPFYGMVIYINYGLFSTMCDGTGGRFPLDHLNCNVDLQIWLSKKMINFTKIDIQFPNGRHSFQNRQWIFKNDLAKNNLKKFGQETYFFVQFSLILTRISSVAFSETIFPCFLPCLVQGFVFVLPSLGSQERLLFGSINFLTFIIVASSTSIPNRHRIQGLLIFETILGIATILWAAIVSNWIDMNPREATKPVSLLIFKFRKHRFLDFIGCILFFTIQTIAFITEVFIVE